LNDKGILYYFCERKGKGPCEVFYRAERGGGEKKKGGGFRPHPNTHTSRGKKNHLIRELALIEETGGFGLGPESLKGIINENRVGVLIQVNSGLI